MIIYAFSGFGVIRLNVLRKMKNKKTSKNRSNPKNKRYSVGKNTKTAKKSSFSGFYKSGSKSAFKSAFVSGALKNGAKRGNALKGGFVKPGTEMKGRFFAISWGGLFFELNDGGELSDEKYYIDAEDTLGAMNGDLVTVKAVGKRRDVVVTGIEERAVKKVIGTVYTDERTEESYLDPDDSKIRFNFLIVGTECKEKAKDGDKAEIKITYYPEDTCADGEGVLTAVFGDSCTREANYSAILRSTEIITEFGKAAAEQAASHEHDILSADGREDLRSLNIFTIDGEGAKDLDDAVSVERKGDGYVLGVHIADVSNYVREDTALDKEAMQRGTSVYFADKVVPMLPVTLSNGICSLNAGVDRYTLSAFIELDKFGEIKGAELKKSIINSRVRGVYSEINAIVGGSADEKLKEKYSAILDGTLDTMLELYEKLRRKSEKRGALELDSTDEEIILGEDGEPVDIIKRERGVGERLIEQFMLCANEAVAAWLTERGLPCVYRVHEKPDSDKVSEFINFAHNLGIKTDYVKKENVTAEYLGRILQRAGKREGLSLPVSYVLLRTMKKAFYSNVNGGHFGLSSKCYCHFTSPIRRYPDLAVHRIISAALSGSGDVKRRYSAFAEKAAKKSSECEIKALTAEREISALYKTIFMSKHIGEEFTGVISSVTSFGMFCMLDNTCEGLIPIAMMKNKYYYNSEAMTLTAADGSAYRIGDKVKIKVKNAVVSLRQIDFELLSEPEPYAEKLMQFAERHGGYSKKR